MRTCGTSCGIRRRHGGTQTGTAGVPVAAESTKEQKRFGLPPDDVPGRGISGCPLRAVLGRRHASY